MFPKNKRQISSLQIRIRRTVLLCCFFICGITIFGQAPVNDDFANAIALSPNGCSANAAYTTLNATPDLNAGSCWANGPNANVWFSFVSTATGTIQVNLDRGAAKGDIRFSYLALWEADGTTELACSTNIDPHDDISLLYTGLTPTTTYYISVDRQYTSTNDDFTLCLSDQPTNDYLEGATNIDAYMNGCSSDAEFSTLGASRDRNAASCWPNVVGPGPYRNVWFEVTAPATGIIEVKLDRGGLKGMLRTAYMALWEADGTTEVACNSYRIGSDYDDISMLASGLTAGNSYYISVDNTYINEPDDFTLCLSDQPTNDYFEGATDITGLIGTCSANEAFSTLGATFDRNTGSCWPAQVEHNKWFSFTAPSTGRIEVNLDSGGAQGTLRHAYMALWDTDGTTELACTTYVNPDDDLSMQYLSLTPGTTYYVSVDNRYVTTTETFALCLDALYDYDFYEGAIDVTSLINSCSTDGQYTTAGATPDRNGGSEWNSPNAKSNRWFRFTAPANGQINITIDVSGTKGTQRYSQLALWEADGVTEIRSENWFEQFDDVNLGHAGLTPGATYYISVDSHALSSVGTFTLCLSDTLDYDFYEGAIDITSFMNSCSPSAIYSTDGASHDRNMASEWTVGGPRNNRWFMFDAPATGEAHIRVRRGGSNGDQRFTQLALWEADGVTELTSDRYYDQGDQVDVNYLGLTPGSRYYISVDSYAGQGTFTMCIEDQVDYDLYEGAIDVTAYINGSSPDAAFSTRGASPDRNPGSSWGGSGPGQNRWFYFIAPDARQLNITVDIGGTKGTQTRTLMALWEQDGLTEVSSTVFNAAGDDVQIQAPGLTPGQIYYISVTASTISYMGSFTLALSTDNDGDGVGDSVDLDDDNDGILDTVESCRDTDIAGTIGVGNNVVNATYNLEGTDLTYTLNNPDNVQITGYDAGLQGMSIRLAGAAGNTGSLTSEYSNPIALVGFKMTDFDNETRATIEVYDENNVLYDLTVSGVVSVGTAITQTGNLFVADAIDIDGDDPADDPITSILFYFESQVSRIVINFEYPSGSSTRFTQPVFCSLDSDLDGLANYLDLDSDDDGIPDNVEAQTTVGYIPPNTDDAATYLTNNGVNSAYLGGLNPTNTDTIDNPDYLDLDSDNEGNNDASESGIVPEGNDIDNDGLDDSSDANTTGYADPGGTIDNPLSAPLILPDVDGDATTGGDIDFRDAMDDSGPDSDSDGVPDSVDLDDDNDGIPDIHEQGSSIECDETFILDGAHTVNTHTTTNLNTDASGINYDFSTLNGVLLDTSVVPAHTNTQAGNHPAEFVGSNQTYVRVGIQTDRNAGQQATLTINFPGLVKNPTLLFSSLKDNAGSSAPSTYAIYYDLVTPGATLDRMSGDVDFYVSGNRVGATMLASGVNGTGVVKFNGIFNQLTFNIGHITNNDDDGLITTLINMGYYTCVDNGFSTAADTDNDGINNILDLDSDNDGIYDAVEAGHNQPHTNGRLNGTIGSDGLPDLVRLIPDYSSINYDIAESLDDADLNPNFLDLDADGDGIPDNVEAQTSIGYIPSNPDNAANYLTNNGVNSAYLGGLNPTNTDTTDNPDYLDADSDNEGGNDTVEAQITLSNVDSDNDGLDDSTDATADYSDVGGTIDDPLSGSIILLDTDRDANSGGDVDFRDAQDDRLDTDADGIADAIDYDDDNDGILDSEELNVIIGNTQPDCTGETILDFSTVPTLESGTALLQGAVYRFPNVTAGTDALVTIVETFNASVADIDNNTAEAQAFRPRTAFDISNVGKEGYIEYRMQFVSSGGTTPVTVPKFFININDTDGNVDYSEEIYVENPSHYIISNPTDLSVSYEFPWIVATGGTTEYPGAGNTNPQANFGINYENRSEIRFRAGITTIVPAVAASGREHNLDFRCTTNYINPEIYILDSDGDGYPNPIDLDSDNDGILDVVEAGHNQGHTLGRITGPVGIDGVPDTVQTDPDGGTVNYTIAESSDDTDLLPNYVDLDADGDGIPDNVEAQTTIGYIIPNGTVDGNGVDMAYPNGLTPTNTDTQDNPDYLDVDSDNEGGNDTEEMALTLSGNDSDYDGLDDATDATSDYTDTGGTIDNLLVAPIIAPDMDNDATTGGDVDFRDVPDNDNDGIDDNTDLDDDNDGIPDTEEDMNIDGDDDPSTDPTDTDNDGVWDYIDLDSDNDGIPDNVEAQTTIGYIAPNGVVDANGLDTAYPAGLVPTNTDGTDNPDYLDTDSDNEGGDDTTEAGISLTGVDTDNDGLDDATDATPDYTDVGGTIDNPLTAPVILPDSDADASTGGDVDFRDAIDDIPVDLDADDDGILDSFEDLNADGDNDPATNPTNSDNDIYPDYLDIDSDNDGIPDNVEAQTTSGYIPPSLIDANNNGVDDAYESGTEIGLIPVNTDGIDMPDYLDEDSDDDGVPDNIEAHDFDQDGIADVLFIGSDKDDDGLDDNYEGSEQLDIDVNDEINDPINDLPNTDGDLESDYRDLDDDNDGIPTMGEDVNGDMNYSNDDWDNDGIPDYLDPDVQSDDELEIYNVITPNGDGIHDVLTIRSIENYPNNDIKVFNRWGILVYETSGYNNQSNYFDGRSQARVTVNNGELLPIGTYFYILNYQDLDGSMKQLSGHLYLN